ncbi:MAG TPA: hypothetical protein VIK86_09615 [Candidatus Paceibacterota bacterium]
MDANKRERKVIKISKKKFTIVTVIIVVILLFVAWAAMSVVTNTFGIGAREKMTGQNIVPSMPSINDNLGSSNKGIVQQPDYYGNPQPNITDNREFLKTNYSATIKTRNVSEVIQDVTNIVKGADGRIDNSYSSEKSGRVSFVVAKSKFEQFKNQIESITNKKLYTETISSKNLLNQKQNIEEQTGNIVNTLANLQSQKTTLENSHIQTVTIINKEITRIKAELVSVREVIATSTEPLVLESFRNQESALIKQEAVQKTKLTNENNSYLAQSQNLDNLINNYNEGLTVVNKQDSQFTDNIETVNGYVDVNFVSLWEIAEIFSPIHPSIIIIILVILIWIYLKRKGTIPRVELQ